MRVWRFIGVPSATLKWATYPTFILFSSQHLTVIPPWLCQVTTSVILASASFTTFWDQCLSLHVCNPCGFIFPIITIETNVSLHMFSKFPRYVTSCYIFVFLLSSQLAPCADCRWPPTFCWMPIRLPTQPYVRGAEIWLDIPAVKIKSCSYCAIFWSRAHTCFGTSAAQSQKVIVIA